MSSITIGIVILVVVVAVVVFVMRLKAPVGIAVQEDIASALLGRQWGVYSGVDGRDATFLFERLSTAPDWKSGKAMMTMTRHSPPLTGTLRARHAARSAFDTPNGTVTAATSSAAPQSRQTVIEWTMVNKDLLTARLAHNTSNSTVVDGTATFSRVDPYTILITGLDPRPIKLEL